MWIPKDYHPFKLISPVQQQTEMAKMLVKRKRGTGKLVQKKNTGVRKQTQKNKTGMKKTTQKKKTGNNSVNKKPGRKNTTVRRDKKSIRGRRMGRKDIYLWRCTNLICICSKRLVISTGTQISGYPNPE